MPVWMYPAIPIAAIFLAVQGYVLLEARRRRKRELKRLVDEILPSK